VNAEEDALMMLRRKRGALDAVNAEEDALMMLRRKREPWML
jgi:hypothetical protein